MNRSGPLPSLTALATADATGTPGSEPPRSPVERTLVAPWAQGVPATASASAPAYTASPVSPSDRALARSSRVRGLTVPSVASAYTQIRLRAMCFLLSIGVLDDLEAVEELDDLAEGFAVVLDDLAGFALGCVLDGDDLLAGTSGTDLRGVEAEIGDGDLFDRLRLGGHEPREGRVAGRDHASGNANEGGQRGRSEDRRVGKKW